MKNKNRALLPVLAPLILGMGTALVFLANYLHKNRAIITIRNQTGHDLLGSQLRITSLPKEQEVGEIKDKDSAKIQFEKFGDGAYIFTGQFRDGKTMRDSGGHVAAGTSYKDEILLEMKNDSIVASFRQNGFK